MDLNSWSWSTQKKYPKVSKIYGARSIYYELDNSFIVFGGELGTTELAQIAAFTPSPDGGVWLIWKNSMRTKRAWTSG